MLNKIRNVFVAATLVTILSLTVPAFAQAPAQTPAQAPNQGGGQGGPNPRMGGRGERHPVIRRSIHQLEQVRMELNREAARDFQGHRAQAVKSIDEAIDQLKQALQSDKE